jgi:cytochrome c biogenesis protein CcdA
MQQQRATWGEVFRSFGEAVLEVLRAEAAVLAEQWKKAGLLLGFAFALGGVVFFSMFWLLGLVVLATVDLVRKVQEWQLWQASLLVAAVLLLFMILALFVAWLLVRRLENPLSAVRERMSDHLAWWQDNLPEDDHHLSSGRASDDSARDGHGAEKRRP